MERCYGRESVWGIWGGSGVTGGEEKRRGVVMRMVRGREDVREARGDVRCVGGRPSCVPLIVCDTNGDHHLLASREEG